MLTQKPPSQREGDREAAVGVSEVGRNNSYERVCEGMTFLRRQHSCNLLVPYLRHSLSQLR